MTELIISAEDQRSLAIDLFNHVWSLLDLDVRSTEQDDDMVHAAHASRWHWGQVGGPQEAAVGEWQCSRVYAVLDRPEPALHHARRCLTLTQEQEMAPFVAASAYEALARAHAVGGDLPAASEARDKAVRLAADLADPDDRAVIDADIATLPID